MANITTNLTKSSYFLIKTELNQVVGIINIPNGKNDLTEKLSSILTKRFKVDTATLIKNYSLNELTSNLSIDVMLERKPCLYITETFLLERTKVK